MFYDPRNRSRSQSVTDLTTISVENDMRDIETLREHFHFVDQVLGAIDAFLNGRWPECAAAVH